MLKAKELDPKRGKLHDLVLNLMERREAIQKLLQESKDEVSRVVELGIDTGELKVGEYKKAKESCELYEDILLGLTTRLNTAQLNLWNFDLQKIETEYKNAKAKVTECRTEVLNLMADKTNYIRSANSDKTLNSAERADRLAAFDVLLVDARNRSRQAEITSNQLKTKLEQLKREYNENAVELGGDPQKLLTQESYMGHG